MSTSAAPPAKSRSHRRWWVIGGAYEVAKEDLAAAQEAFREADRRHDKPPDKAPEGQQGEPDTFSREYVQGLRRRLPSTGSGVNGLMPWLPGWSLPWQHRPAGWLTQPTCR